MSSNRKIIFWSSVDASAVLGPIVRELESEGLDAKQNFIISADSYRKSSSAVSRFILRLRMYIEYPLRLSIDCLFGSGSRVVVVTTNTFFAPLIAIVFAKKGQEIVHLIWDLYPDVLVDGDEERLKNPLMVFLSKVVGLILKRSSANVFLGKRLFSYAQSRYLEISKPYIIPVGGDNELFLDSKPLLMLENSPVDILYCGNLGSMHDIDALLEALDSESFSNSNFNLTFNASGANYAGLKERLREKKSYPFANIRLDSPLSDPAWRERMREAQVALITLKQNAEKLAMPSKVYSALAAGQAILAVCSPDSDLAVLIEENDCGWVADPRKPEQLQSAMLEITTNSELLVRKRRNALRAGRGKYSSRIVAKEWMNLFGKL